MEKPKAPATTKPATPPANGAAKPATGATAAPAKAGAKPGTPAAATAKPAEQPKPAAKAPAPAKKSNKKIIILAFLGVLVLAGGGIAVFAPELFSDPNSPHNGTSTTAEAMIKGKFVSANLLITNNNDFVLKNMNLRCNIYSKAGDVLQVTNNLINKKVDAKSTLTLANFPIGIESNNPKSVDCNITKFDE